MTTISRPARQRHTVSPPGAPERGSPWSLSAFGLLVALAGLAVSFLGVKAAIVVASGCAVLLFCTVPRHVLPALALVAFALLPTNYLPFPSDPGVVSGGLVVVALWTARYFADRPHASTPAPLWSLVALAGWIAVSVLRLGVDVLAAAWAMNFGVMVLLPAALLPGERGSLGLLERVWTLLAAVLGAYAVIETSVLSSNPLYDWAFQGAHLQQVSDIYRATTTIGHPLVNATFFAVAVPLCLDRYLRTRRLGSVLLAGAALAGLLATASRGPLVGAAVGTLVALATAMARADFRPRLVRAVTAAALVFVVSAIFFSGSLRDRNRSDFGSATASYRRESLQVGLELAKEHPVLGVGPARSDVVKRTNVASSSRDLGLENSWLQILVSLGVPGLVLIIHFVSVGAARAWRAREAGRLGALCAYVVSVAGFSALEWQWPALVMFGLLVGLCLASVRDVEAA